MNQRFTMTLILCLLMTFLSTQKVLTDDSEENAEIIKNNKEYLKIKEGDTLNDIWAKAIWISLPSGDFESEDAIKLLQACLKMTKNKAPFYVALGDISSGPIKMHESFNEVTEIAILGEAEIAVEKMIKDHDQNLDSSLYYYLLSVKENPKYKIGWYKLAKHAEGDLQESAINKLIELDPDNAFPYYLKAFLYERNKNFKFMMKFIKTGNEKETCHIYQTEIPDKFNLVYNDNETFRELKIVGKPITQVAYSSLLKLIGESYLWMDSLDDDIREIERFIRKRVNNLRKKGKINIAIRHLNTMKTFGRKIITATPRQMTIQFAGLANEKSACLLLEEIYTKQEMKKELFEVKADLEKFKKYLNSIDEIIDDMANTSQETEKLFGGKIDLVHIEEAKLEEVLINLGYLKQKPPK